MKPVVEIVIVEGITREFSAQLNGPNFFSEIKRLYDEEKSFDMSRLDRHIIKYQNLKPSTAPQARTGTYAYVFDTRAEIVAFYELLGG
ncbi:hypothetical protein [Spirosoma fluminis]